MVDAGVVIAAVTLGGVTPAGAAAEADEDPLLFALPSRALLDPHRVMEILLEGLDLAVRFHVEDDQENEGDQDDDYQVHPQDVDEDVQPVRPHCRRLDVNVVVIRSVAVGVGAVGRDRLGDVAIAARHATPLDVELEELWNVVEKGEGDDWCDERLTLVSSPPVAMLRMADDTNFWTSF